MHIPVSYFSRIILGLVILLCLMSCGGSGGGSSNNTPPKETPNNPDPDPICSRTAIESTLQSTLSTISTDVDFSFYIEDATGESFAYNRGNSTLDTAYRSASTSKWVAAAAILQLVDDGLLSLSDNPRDYLSDTDWTIDSEDRLYTITLAQLLSFTSGLTEVPLLCPNQVNKDFFECLATISTLNIDNGEIPGAVFNYNSNHLQAAGAMAIKAGSFVSWAELFSAFKNDTGLFSNSDFDLPSTTNPRLAGGMTWTGNDYIDFIRAYKNSEFYSSTSIVNTAISDQLTSSIIGESPAFDGLGEDWHYGFGLWIECHSAVFNCTEVTQVSSAGAYGAFPFWNIQYDYFGIIAKEGELGTFTTGYELFDTVRDDVEAWVACPNS